jgi:hypothetical protein
MYKTIFLIFTLFFPYHSHGGQLPPARIIGVHHYSVTGFDGSKTIKLVIYQSLKATEDGVRDKSRPSGPANRKVIQILSSNLTFTNNDGSTLSKLPNSLQSFKTKLTTALKKHQLDHDTRKSGIIAKEILNKILKKILKEEPHIKLDEIKGKTDLFGI